MHIREIAVTLYLCIGKLSFQPSQKRAKSDFLRRGTIVDRIKSFCRRIDTPNPAYVNGYRIELRAHAVARLFDRPCIDNCTVRLHDEVIARLRPTEAALRYRPGMIGYNICGLIALITGSAMHCDEFNLSHYTGMFSRRIRFSRITSRTAMCSSCSRINDWSTGSSRLKRL